MSARLCGACGHCLVRTPEQGAAVCAMRRDEGRVLIYVDVDLDLGCPLFVPRGAPEPVWTDGERKALADAALGMAKATGHGVRDCVIEIVRVVGDYRARHGAAHGAA